ncbi:LOW QUALITY PROTEIN: docking protein 1 [Sceloporus undulatus]|uniref:LOW QUALITY PROTEIN: docking protein 1 n=1 Tax=Sceloporus undulatus TaxID=8520 RepID=UPI001C4B3C21|nr:LOW QUALITY PROTEIN: docking protein 1 [Sceloporus undulatus]
MEAPVKEGPLLLLLQQTPPGIRLGPKRWKKGWFSLFRGSGRGVARLEFSDGKNKKRTVVRLSECLSVAPAPESRPREGLDAFRLETPRRTLLLAAEPPEAQEWVTHLCQAAFPQQTPGQAADQAEGQPQEMATNAIYFSQEEGSEFWVTVQKTEAAERCGLQGRYRLRASRESLLLVDPLSGQTLYSWPYRLLRRYGRDKVMFSFEAGRRCESGPGNFTFETPQGSEIFRLVEVAIQAQKAQVEEDRRSGPSMDADVAAAVGQLHSALATSLSLEAEGPGPKRHQWWEGVPQNAMGEGDGASHAVKGQAMQDSVAPLSGPPLPSSPEEQAADAAASVYSEPLDVVRGSQARPDPLYADPVDSRGKEGLRPQSSEWRLYEQVGPGVGDGGHIYDEPEGRAPQPAPTTVPAIYDEAQLPSEAWRTQGLESPAGYELPYLPGTGDYAVPPFHPKAGLPRVPKPCPVPKPHRSHKGSPQPGGTRKPKMAARNGSNNNNSNTAGGQPGRVGVSTSEPIYSQVRKPLRGQWPPGEEQSVDGSCPASAVYEDLGEI